MNFVPQVETAEISDADLDQVSGGNIGIDTGATDITAGGAFGAGFHAEAGPFSLTAGLGASAAYGGASAQGQAHTTMV
ncbi:hypothetical protein ACIP29_10495 [Streptomyces coelicoflavus]|uniref:hypothetical protein n=1 Tax=Streptomyces coelicoflavus TaxID=285562 RepID=UPI0002477525|nr:hypothetical protein SMCF_7114 [Streptomyces coelicoflavus ZG0656]KPC72147.1 hypothetical protein ADL35_32270 [Streptomyces sp. NRRL WC-3753]MZE42299.1 hypothetical protein [Streptomyces sp. SID5477]